MYVGPRRVLLGGQSPYSDAALALDFKNGIYRGSGGIVPAVSGLPGYSYTRLGAKQEQDASGTGFLSFAANVPGIVPGLGYWSRPAASNTFLNSAVGATQNITVTAQTYTLSFFGTGTITLSGASTAGPLNGTGANNRVSLTFAASAGTLTVTVSGTCTHVQVVPGGFQGPIIDTGGSNGTTGIDPLVLANSVSAPFTLSSEFGLSSITSSQLILGLDDATTSNRIHLRTNATGLDTLIVAAGSVSRLFAQAVALSTSALNKVALRVKADGHTTVAVNGALLGVEQGAVTMPTPALLTKTSVGNGVGSSPLNGYVSKGVIYAGTDTDAQLIARTA